MGRYRGGWPDKSDDGQVARRSEWPTSAMLTLAGCRARARIFTSMAIGVPTRSMMCCVDRPRALPTALRCGTAIRRLTLSAPHWNGSIPWRKTCTMPAFDPAIASRSGCRAGSRPRSCSSPARAWDMSATLRSTATTPARRSSPCSERAGSAAFFAQPGYGADAATA